MHLPWAAGVSGVVKPFNQLRVRGNSNFNHVRERFHLKSPVMSAEQTEEFQFFTAGVEIIMTPRKTGFLMSPLTSLMQKSPPGE